jgi:hypothetical protein
VPCCGLHCNTHPPLSPLSPCAPVAPWAPARKTTASHVFGFASEPVWHTSTLNLYDARIATVLTCGTGLVFGVFGCVCIHRAQLCVNSNDSHAMRIHEHNASPNRPCLELCHNCTALVENVQDGRASQACQSRSICGLQAWECQQLHTVTQLEGRSARTYLHPVGTTIITITASSGFKAGTDSCLRAMAAIRHSGWSTFLGVGIRLLCYGMTFIERLLIVHCCQRTLNRCHFENSRPRILRQGPRGVP